jgi:hypothetical protein
MKKLIFVMLCLFVFALTGCDLFGTAQSTTEASTSQTSSLTTTTLLETGTTTSDIILTTRTTDQTITEDKTTRVITTVINDDIYLRLIEGQDTVEINHPWIDSGAELVVNDIASAMETDDVVDTSTLGLYQVIYYAGYQNQRYEITRYVMVVDQTAPVMTLNMGIDTIVLGETWIDAGVTVIDNSGEAITATVSGIVDTSTPGTYLITYEATDSSGNSSTLIRYVTVIDQEAA